jgi:hypothetical protein
MKFYFVPAPELLTARNPVEMGAFSRASVLLSAEIGPKTGPTISRPSSDVTGLKAHEPASLQGFSEWS